VALNQTFAPQGLVILAFPCNQFGSQEPGSNAEIRKFVEGLGVPVADQAKKTGFHIMDKIEVNGDGIHPVYKFLKAAGGDSSDLKWNFSSYWLVSRGGSIERLEGMKNTPKNFSDKISAALS